MDLQEQTEVLGKVMKGQFDQTMKALSPSLITPQFPRSLLCVPSVPLVAGERRGQHDLLAIPLLRWIEAELLHEVSFGLGDRRFVAALGLFITPHGGGAAIHRAKEARSGLVFDMHAHGELSCLPLQVFGRLGAWSWHVDSSCFSWDCILGNLSVSKPGPYLSVLQSYWNLHVWNRKGALFLSSV